MTVKLAGSTAGQNDSIRGEKMHAVSIKDLHAGDPVILHHNFGNKSEFANFCGGSAHRSNEGITRNSACGISTGVKNAGVRVGRFESSCEVSVFPVEVHAEFHKVIDALSTFFTENLNGRFPTQPCPGNESVSNMLGNGVVIRTHRGNAALRIVCVALSKVSFCHEDHLVVLTGFSGGNQAGNAAADHNNSGHGVSSLAWQPTSSLKRRARVQRPTRRPRSG